MLGAVHGVSVLGRATVACEHGTLVPANAFRPLKFSNEKRLDEMRFEAWDPDHCGRIQTASAKVGGNCVSPNNPLYSEVFRFFFYNYKTEELPTGSMHFFCSCSLSSILFHSFYGTEMEIFKKKIEDLYAVQPGFINPQYGYNREDLRTF